MISVQVYYTQCMNLYLRFIIGYRLLNGSPVVHLFFYTSKLFPLYVKNLINW
jgi:hypothetical protein